ncbi:unnamed protein product [Absidia cylindrospora]
MMLHDPISSSLVQRPSQQEQQGPRRKRPLPKLPQRTPSGQFISLGPCWISSSNNPPPPSFSSYYHSATAPNQLISRSSSWYGNSTLSNNTTVCEPTTTNMVNYSIQTPVSSKIMSGQDSMKMETNTPSSDYYGIHQKPYEPSYDESVMTVDDVDEIEDRSNCTSPIDANSPHTPEDIQHHDPTLLKRYSSPLYQLSHRHSMLLSPTSSIHSRDYLQPASFTASSSSPQPQALQEKKWTYTNSTRRSVSTVDLFSSASRGSIHGPPPQSASSTTTIPSPWLDPQTNLSSGTVYTQTPNQIENDDYSVDNEDVPTQSATEWKPTPSSTSLHLHTMSPPPPSSSHPSPTTTRFTIASFSLTHDKDALATYRRMATKTKDQQVQMSYMMYLIQVADLYRHQKRGDLRLRLLHEAGYWLRRLAKAKYPPALVIKGRWYIQQHSNYSASSSATCSLVSLDDLNLMMLASTSSSTSTANSSSATDLVTSSSTSPAFLDRHQKQQWDKAKQCFQQAAKSGSMDAHYELALLLYKKMTPSKSSSNGVSKIMTSLRLAADQNHLLACYKMAKVLLFGQLDQAQHFRHGLLYLEKAAEITRGEDAHPINAKASFMLSCIYAGDHSCVGVKQLKGKNEAAELVALKNLTQARHYLDKAVALRNPEALLRLGQLYESGHAELGYAVDPWQAFQWYLEAASEAHQPQAMLSVAQWYAQGIPGHLATNPTLAFKWCQRASEQCLDQADYLLGTYYEAGYGVAPDYPKALACYDKAASKGYTPAEEMLNRQPACVHRHASSVKPPTTYPEHQEKTNRGDKKKKEHTHPRLVMSHKAPELGNCTIM